MLNSISKLGGASEKFGNWAGKFTTASAAIFSKPDESIEPAKAEFTFTRPIVRDGQRRKGIETAEPTSEIETDDDTFLFDEDDDDCVDDNDDYEAMFSSCRSVEDILDICEIQGEGGRCNDPAAEADEVSGQFTPPLLLGFNPELDDIELEYMVAIDPVTGHSVAPIVVVERSEDGKAGNIFLNGQMVACVVGAQDLCAKDVKLVQADA